MVLVAGPSSPSSAQDRGGPARAETYRDVLDKLLPADQQSGKNRFQLRLRILSPAAPETQIDIAYSIDQKATATVASMSKSLQRTVADWVAKGSPIDIDRISTVVTVNRATVALRAEVTRSWLEGFWNAVGEFAQQATRHALKHDGTEAVSITLDPTMYEISYRDLDNEVRFTVSGPDPGWSGDLNKLDAIVRWAVGIRRAVEALSDAQRGKR